MFQGYTVPIVAQYVQAISYIVKPVRGQLCLAMATRMMPIWLLGMSVRGSNLEFATLKIDSLCISLAHETKLGFKVDLLQLMPSLPLSGSIVGRDPTIQWQYHRVGRLYM